MQPLKGLHSAEGERHTTVAVNAGFVSADCWLS